jgi:glycosyltransferase involved in cell wall biosynthesis
VRTLFGPIETWYEEHFRTSATGTTAISRALAQRAIDLGVTRTTVMWLPNGCTPAGQRPTRTAARARLAIARNEKILLHLGVLTPGDYAFLRSAFEQAQKSRSDLRLVLAGRTGTRIVPKERVLVTGALPESTLHDWVAAADACVIPCRKTIGNLGRWPSKVNEYMSAGRAVVMPRVGDVGTMVEEAEAGWVTDATPSAFADGMVRAASDDAGTQIAGVRARTLAETTLAWSRLTDHLLAFYERLTNGEATAPTTLSAAGQAQ